MSQADQWPITAEPIDIVRDDGVGTGAQITQRWTSSLNSEEITVLDVEQARTIVAALVDIFGLECLPEDDSEPVQVDATTTANREAAALLATKGEKKKG